MIIKIGKVENRTSKATGKTFKTAEVISGDTVTDVSVWPDYSLYDKVVEGAEVEGIIETKGQYKNLKDGNLGARPSNIPRTGIKAAQERKETMIKQAQERKNESIAYFNAVNSAIALLKDKNMETEDLQASIVFWRDWFLSEWEKYEVTDYQNKHQAF